MLASGGVRANSLHCVSLKQRAALVRLKLCSSARPEGKGSRAALRALAALGPGRRDERGAGSGAGFSAAQALGSDHDFAQRNSCSDPNPGMLGAARVFCQFMLPAVHYRRDDERLLSARSSRWTQWDKRLQAGQSRTSSTFRPRQACDGRPSTVMGTDRRSRPQRGLRSGKSTAPEVVPQRWPSAS